MQEYSGHSRIYRFRDFDFAGRAELIISFDLSHWRRVSDRPLMHFTQYIKWEPRGLGQTYQVNATRYLRAIISPSVSQVAAAWRAPWAHRVPQFYSPLPCPTAYHKIFLSLCLPDLKKIFQGLIRHYLRLYIKAYAISFSILDHFHIPETNMTPPNLNRTNIMEIKIVVIVLKMEINSHIIFLKMFPLTSRLHT